MTKKIDNFKFVAKKIPTDAGCYLFYDVENTLLYVGKAKNLRKRVTSYFRKTQKSPKTDLMVSKIQKIETRTVGLETEALILENNLIKEFKPRFNILLRDDKSFLYLKITKELIPRIVITRRIVSDGSFYIGPKTSAKQFRSTIAFCQKIFQIRTCKLEFEPHNGGLKVLKNPENKKIPCLDFHINKCSGPCSAEISIEEYLKNIGHMKQFLRGKTAEVLKGLQAKMMDFAQDKNFEAAAKLRDLIQSISISTQKQVVDFLEDFNADFIHFYRQNNKAFFVRMLFRNGKYIDQNEILFQAPALAEDSDVLEKFCMQFYEKVDQVPPVIYLPETLESQAEIESLLQTKLNFPQKGDKQKILDLVAKNAKNFAKKQEIEALSQAENFSKALPELAEALNLKEPPTRIECYDVSHFSGKFPVASQVVFVDGKPKNAEYRRFHIKDLPEGKIDDFASMNEVLRRRFAASDNKKFAENFPQLIVLDGGKGQLSAVMKLFKEESLIPPDGFDPTTQIIALAKREEQIFRPGISDPLELDFNAPALKLLQRLRDEAHRFAITFNRALRAKNQTKSILDEIDGIGGVTKKKLMKKFETVSGISKATDEQLLEVLNKKQLEKLRENL